ncbi:MAG: hypothetical protein K0U41_06430 [Gammaproteobacteria bacterium]|nr:hypothetical protein [Gammaproteobacteria bacterium]
MLRLKENRTDKEILQVAFYRAIVVFFVWLCFAGFVSLGLYEFYGLSALRLIIASLFLSSFWALLTFWFAAQNIRVKA